MYYVTSDELEGVAGSKYEAVVIAALRARQLNLLERKRMELVPQPEEGEEEEMEEETETVRSTSRDKVIVIAMRELLEQKINYKGVER